MTGDKPPRGKCVFGFFSRPVCLACPQFGGGGAMAPQAQRAHIAEIALAAALGYGHHVVGVPEMTAAAPVLLELPARGVIELAFVFAQRVGIEAALRADAAIAREDLVAKISGVGAQPPLAHAGVAAKGEAAARNFGPAPPAGAALPLHPTAGPGTCGAHTRSS